MNAGGWLLSTIISIVLGLAVNECSELSPALARRLVRWSARRRYRDAARAEERAEELAAYVNDRPGKLFKLIVALGFAARALGRAGARFPVPAVDVPSFLPRSLALDLRFAPYSNQDASVWPERAQRVRDELKHLDIDVEAAMAAHGKRYWGSDGYRLERLAKATGNAGWSAVADNVARLQTAVHRLERMPDEGAGPYIGAAIGRAILSPVRNTTPTQAQVAAFCDAVRNCQHDIRQLTAPASSPVKDQGGRQDSS